MGNLVDSRREVHKNLGRSEKNRKKRIKLVESRREVLKNLGKTKKKRKTEKTEKTW